MRRSRAVCACASVLALGLGALAFESATAAEAAYDPTRDYHSYANPHAMRVEHADLALDVDFAARRLSGTVDLRVRRSDAAARELVLDTRDLIVRLSAARLAELDAAYHFTDVGNARIAHSWLRIAIRNRYEPALEPLPGLGVEPDRDRVSHGPTSSPPRLPGSAGELFSGSLPRIGKRGSG